MKFLTQLPEIDLAQFCFQNLINIFCSSNFEAHKLFSYNIRKSMTFLFQFKSIENKQNFFELLFLSEQLTATIFCFN
jgi:hypothetical protein